MNVEHHHDKETCRALAARLSEYLDHELPDEVRREVELHFQGCANCERFLESLRRTRDCARFLPPLELTPDRLRKLAKEAKRRLKE